MSEWKEYTLGELTTDGKGTYGIAASAVDYCAELPTYLRITDINDDGTIDFAGLKSVDAPNSSNYILKENDIVFARTGASTGRSYFYDKRDGDFVYAGFLIKFSLDPQKVNPRILKYYTHSRVYYNWVHSFENGATRGNINAKTLAEMKIILPPRQAQDKIVSILSSLDDKIAVNRRICENLEAQAQALFKNWFVDFAPFKDGKFVESELGLIPEGWRVGKADDFYTINIGKTPPRAERQWFSESKGNNKIWISISDMGGCGAFISDSKEYLTPEAQSKFNVVMVPAGTILLSFKLTIGRVAIADNELTTNEAIARFILPNSNYREFTYLYLRQYNYGSLGSTSSIATAVNSKIIKSMPFLMPSAEVMTKFSSVVSKLFDEIRIFNNESHRLATLRDTLLPKLMSGEIKI